MKEIIILGSTGSIGIQTLSIVKRYKDKFKVVGLSCGSNIDLFNQQVLEFCPNYVCVCDKSKLKDLKVNKKTVVLNTLEELASVDVGEVVVTAVVGLAGLLPTISAIKAKKNIALANKETLVAGGEIVMKLATLMGVSIFPVDSEHSAIWQCLNYNKAKDVKNLILTASGGAFRGKTKAELENITLKDALSHPTWDMGVKVTIDSASLMNKGFEVIEAACLFNVSAQNIKVVVHRQSIVHSMVCFNDNSVIAQMSAPNMVLPIQLALTYPERWETDIKELNFSEIGNLTFEKPDVTTFPCLDIAYNCAIIGGLYPAILNSANEEAVNAFISNKIRFLDISYYIEECLNAIPNKGIVTIEDILETDKIAREHVRKSVNKV